RTENGESELSATRGVVLAGGGFSSNRDIRKHLFPTPDDHHTLAVREAEGDGMRMAAEVGAAFNDRVGAMGAWCPVSVVEWPDGQKGVFPHIVDRGKPGIIGVTRDGKRFCNEGEGYHDYVTNLLRVTDSGKPAESWLI